MGPTESIGWKADIGLMDWVLRCESGCGLEVVAEVVGGGEEGFGRGIEDCESKALKLECRLFGGNC